MNLIDALKNKADYGYGQRPSGELKGKGFFGELKMQDGSNNVATEMTIGINIRGKETDVPLLVPTLSKNELDYLLKGGKPTPTIVEKAAKHAIQRIDSGISPYAD